MAGDSAVVVKTRKFIRNPLLARRQVRYLTRCAISSRHCLWRRDRNRASPSSTSPQPVGDPTKRPERDGCNGQNKMNYGKVYG
mmetsp:Transcript_14604/g.29221  ORF Transcript_14604/g.29221 Transcript_14604/m.29221 type:complete len:83 (-) Transcript_14604:864-1112(-)